MKLPLPQVTRGSNRQWVCGRLPVYMIISFVLKGATLSIVFGTTKEKEHTCVCVYVLSQFNDFKFFPRIQSIRGENS